MAGLWLFFLALFYLLILFLGTKTSWSYFANIYWVAGSISLLFAGQLWCRKLQQAAAWFHTNSTPHRLWRAWVRRLLQKAWLYLLGFSLSMNLLAANHHDMTNWSAVWAISALCLSASVLFSLLISGLIPRALSLSLLAVFIGLFYVAGVPYSIRLNEWLQLAWHWHFAYLAVWALISGLLLVYWKNPPAQQEPRRFFSGLSNSRLFQGFKNQVLFFPRYSALEKHRDTSLMKFGNGIYFRTTFRSLAILYLFWLVSSFSMGWQEVVQFKHLLLFALTSAFMGSHLMVKDLHWRFLLRPRGLQQGRIASHILRSTFTYYLRLFCLFGGLGLMAYLVLLNKLPTLHSRTIQTTLVSLPLLLLSVCIAIAVRGCQHPHRVSFALFSAILFMSAAFALYAFFQHQNPLQIVIAKMNEFFLIGILLIATLVLAWANKLWTSERLLPYLTPT